MTQLITPYEACVSSLVATYGPQYEGITIHRKGKILQALSYAISLMEEGDANGFLYNPDESCECTLAQHRDVLCCDFAFEEVDGQSLNQLIRSQFRAIANQICPQL